MKLLVFFQLVITVYNFITCSYESQCSSHVQWEFVPVSMNPRTEPLLTNMLNNDNIQMRHEVLLALKKHEKETKWSVTLYKVRSLSSYLSYLKCTRRIVKLRAEKPKRTEWDLILFNASTAWNTAERKFKPLGKYLTLNTDSNFVLGI